MNNPSPPGWLFRLGLVTVFLAFGSASGTAQQLTGAIIGTVKDSTGGALPGVAVVVENEKTGETRTAVTDASGFYQARVLPTGTYRAKFSLDGFKSLSQEGVPVEATVSRTLNVTLEVGGLEETVTVTATPEAVDLDTSTVAYQVSAVELEQIPSATRNYTHLLTSTAGVSADLPPVAVNDTGSISPSVNGTRTTSNSLFYNGVDITSLLSNRGSMDENIVPAPETIEEVKLQTSMYDASTGRSGGGNFQIVTKGGQNAFNGTAYTFFQDKTFTANEFFNERFNLDKPENRRTESGVTFGGPLRKDKAFFYGAYQRTDANTGFVPTARSRALIPQALALISGPRTAQNIVDAFRSLNPTFNLTPADISPLALNILNIINPATGDFFIPGPISGPVASRDRVVSIGRYGNVGADPLIEFRQIVEAQFQQDQFSTKLDYQLTDANRLSGSFFFSNFPSLDPFPDPSSLASPVTLQRNNRGRVLSINDTHVGSNVINELRFGYLNLGNTRQLDDPFLAITNDSVGVINPAVLFDDRDATRRLGHYVNRSINLSWGGPNDVFNQRQQDTFHLMDTVSWIRGNHSLRMGGEFKQHFVATNLPEEQATEFEKIENFQQFLLGLTSEADTQFGFTEKNWKSRDLGFYFLDDWRVNDRLTLNLGVRWDWYGWPSERDGFFGNFDERRITNLNNPIDGFIVPNNIGTTGFSAIDTAIAATARTDSKSTLDSNDLNNFQPRVGFAWSPSKTSDHFVIRGGYGIFADRLTAAFMNTVFSNYPMLREIEITVPTRQVPIANAFSTQFVNGQPVPFNSYLPSTVYLESGAYVVRDGTGIRSGPNPGNVAETFEFRAVDPELVNPYYHQWNIGYQWALTKDLVWEVRYNGSLGQKLLESVSFNQAWDLSDAQTPQAVRDRITAAYRAGGGTANAQDPNALGFGYVNPTTGRPDPNYGPGGRLIPAEVRVSYLGIHDVEAVRLQNADWNSIYHGFQTTVSKRFSKGFQFHGAYTYSQSKDNFSTDPGSTAGGGRPDVPNSGFVVENDSRNLDANRAVSDFDRPHRFSASFVYMTPSGASAFVRNWQFAAYMQFQSGRPFSVFEAEPSKVYRPGFARLDFAPGADADTVRQPGSDEVDEFFNTSGVVGSATGIGNTPRNFLRASSQKRFDLAVSRQFPIGTQRYVELRADMFNLFNWTNFDIPGNDFGSDDFGKLTTTLGGPFMAQFGVRLVF